MVACDAPSVANLHLLHDLTHCESTKDKRLDCQERRIGGELDVKGPLYRTLTEQDCFLGQPMQPRSRSESNFDFDPCDRRLDRAIDFLRSLSGYRRHTVRWHLD